MEILFSSTMNIVILVLIVLFLCCLFIKNHKYNKLRLLIGWIIGVLGIIRFITFKKYMVNVLKRYPSTRESFSYYYNQTIINIIIFLCVIVIFSVIILLLSKEEIIVPVVIFIIITGLLVMFVICIVRSLYMINKWVDLSIYILKLGTSSVYVLFIPMTYLINKLYKQEKFL